MLSFNDGVLYELYTRLDVKRPALWIYTPFPPKKYPKTKTNLLLLPFRNLDAL